MSANEIVSFRDLEVWQSAMELAVGAHKLADRGNRIFLRHVRIAIGSIAELDTQIEIVVRRRLVGELVSAELLSEIVRTRQMLHGLEKALARRLIKSVATAVGTLIALASCFALVI